VLATSDDCTENCNTAVDANMLISKVVGGAPYGVDIGDVKRA